MIISHYQKRSKVTLMAHQEPPTVFLIQELSTPSLWKQNEKGRTIRGIHCNGIDSTINQVQDPISSLLKTSEDASASEQATLKGSTLATKRLGSGCISLDS